MLKQLLATKSVQQVVAEDTAPDEHGVTLKRALDAKALIALGIGAIIGTGIFVLTGIVAANHAGPALILSFVLAGIGCAFAGLCYAEFAAMIPVSGSAYSYAYATLGEFMAWFIGWDLILEYLFSASTVAVGWSGYFVSLLKENLGITLPETLTRAPLAHIDGSWQLTGAIINFPAMLIIGLMTALCYVGIKQSTSVNNVIVLVKVAVIMLFIGFGLSYIDTSNWVPFIPANTGEFGKFGLSGIATGAAVIFFAYIGFDAVSTAAQEAKNPQRDMPRGILISLVICTFFYIAVAAVLTGMVHYTKLGVSAPVALALDTYPALSWLAPIIKLGALAGMSSVILVMMVGQPRIFYAMAKDRMLPPVFAKLHPKYQTPHINTLICGLVAAAVGGLFPIEILGELVSIGTLLAFIIVCLGVLLLRHTRPDLERPFKVPAPWFSCIAGALVCGYMAYALPADTWIRLLVWFLIGLVVYFTYGYRRSHLRQKA